MSNAVYSGGSTMKAHAPLRSLALEIRAMTATDVDAVCAIEQRICEFPWTRGNFADSLAAGHAAWVLCDGKCIIGYAVISQVLDEAELLLIGVAAEQQRSGCGRSLMAYLLDEARRRGAHRMFLEVRESNVAARALYRGFGFAEVGRRAAYYPARDGREAALLLSRAL